MSGALEVAHHCHISYTMRPGRGCLHGFPTHLHVVNGLSTDDALCSISCPQSHDSRISTSGCCVNALTQVFNCANWCFNLAICVLNMTQPWILGTCSLVLRLLELAVECKFFCWASARTSTWCSIPWPLFVSRQPSSCSV